VGPVSATSAAQVTKTSPAAATARKTGGRTGSGTALVGENECQHWLTNSVGKKRRAIQSYYIISRTVMIKAIIIKR